jgi:hypothetical protein
MSITRLVSNLVNASFHFIIAFFIKHVAVNHLNGPLTRDFIQYHFQSILILQVGPFIVKDTIGGTRGFPG